MKFKIDYRFVLILIIAAVCSVLAFSFLNINNVEVLVASQNIGPNEIVTQDMFNTVVVDKTYMPNGYIPTVLGEEILGGTTKYGIAKGSYITSGQFYTQEELEMKKADEATKVFFNLPISPEVAMNGQLEKGDKFNLIASFTITTYNQDDKQDVTRRVFTLLQNVEIKKLSKNEDDELSGIIVLLPPEDVQKVTYALSYASSIYLAKTPINYETTDIDFTAEKEFLQLQANEKVVNNGGFNNVNNNTPIENITGD